MMITFFAGPQKLKDAKPSLNQEACITKNQEMDKINVLVFEKKRTKARVSLL